MVRVRSSILVCCLSSAWAYHANAPLNALESGPGSDAARDPNLFLNQRFQRTGSPVPASWRPHIQKVHDRPPTARTTKKSVAQLIEEQTSFDATVTYVHPTRVSRYRRYGSRSNTPAQSLRRMEQRWKRDPKDECIAHGICHPDKNGDVDWSKEDANTDWSKIDWSGGTNKINWQGDKPDNSNDWSKIDWSGDVGKIDWSGKTRDRDGHSTHKRKRDPRKTGISRCGFTWDDAAAKMGAGCYKDGGCIPSEETDNPDSYWYGHNYSCYTDLPDNGLTVGGRTCQSISDTATDQWCTAFCNDASTFCDPLICDCVFDEGLNNTDHFRNEMSYDLNAPIAEHEPDLNVTNMPTRNDKLRNEVIKAGEAQPSGLPACTWRPDAGCTNETQYECIKNINRGHCSGENWFDQEPGPLSCEASCVHVSLLHPAPYYALWYPGPLAKQWKADEKVPRYQHSVEKFSLHSRGINLRKSDVMMSAICRSQDNQFVGISMYSPNYKAKAERLLRSCSRVGVCCIATLLPSDAFGPDAPEGSEAFRYETISSKPSFILGEMEATKHPVVFLDTDLEFHRFPQLFTPGSWPNGGRDVALFNYWGNETDYYHASTPTTGSGVVFFNQTSRAKAVLTAWAEAMAWWENQRAPDDQVLDTLLKEGGWLYRASYGWLPAACASRSQTSDLVRGREIITAAHHVLTGICEQCQPTIVASSRSSITTTATRRDCSSTRTRSRICHRCVHPPNE